ncbi:hypothetical protein WN943_022800 [Citrus x changshan-huyou]
MHVTQPLLVFSFKNQYMPKNRKQQTESDRQIYHPIFQIKSPKKNSHHSLLTDLILSLLKVYGHFDFRYLFYFNFSCNICFLNYLPCFFFFKFDFDLSFIIHSVQFDLRYIILQTSCKLYIICSLSRSVWFARKREKIERIFFKKKKK